ncbi:MAG TPA: glutathione S-transferase family protein [Xenococcaceae cyanobacterium]|jgi:glutathione S-transferase
MEQAIDLYTWTTPNGYKIPILLEELGWTYNVIPVNIGKGEQFAPEFLKISPNNKIPAIVDRNTADGQTYTDEALRLYGVMEKQLENNSFLAGDYSIADMAIFPWLAAYSQSLDNLEQFPHVQRWLEQIGDRKAVKRGMSILQDK